MSQYIAANVQDETDTGRIESDRSEARHERRRGKPAKGGGRTPSARAASSHVDAYLKTLGARPTFRDGENDRFWAWLIERHPQAVVDRFSDEMWTSFLEEESSKEPVHEAKNATLDLSLDVSLAFSGDLYQKQMTWFEREFRQTDAESPARVLDVGCENGLLTCFYASLWPDADVIGVDRCEAALSCARELSERLGVVNARFVRADVSTDPLEPIVGRDFDLATFSRALIAEALPLSGLEPHLAGTEFSDLDMVRPPGWEALTNVLRNVRDTLSPHGCTVALERLANPYKTVWFVRALGDAGLAVAWDRCHVLIADELQGDAVRFPIVVSARTEGEASPDEEIALAFNEHEQIERLGAEYSLSGAAAEALARSLRLDELLFSAAIHYDPGIEHIEHWRSGGIVLEYQTTSLGFRKAALHPFTAWGELKALALDRIGEQERWGLKVELHVPTVFRSSCGPPCPPTL